MITEQFNDTIELEGGGALHGVDITYHTFGELNSEKNNEIWVCHALTANSDVEAWWPGMVGSGVVRLEYANRIFLLAVDYVVFFE